MGCQRVELAAGTLEVPRVVAGLMRVADWSLDAPGLARWLRACQEMGVDTLDLADIYGGYRAHSIVGAALAADPSLRDELQFITKCGIQLTSEARPGNRVKHYNLSEEYIVESAERALRDLGLERLDLLLLHRPDYGMRPDEVAAAFERLQRDGKVAHFGVSNFATSTFDLLQSRWEQPLVTNQVELSAMRPGALDDGTLEQLYRHHRRAMIWSPLAGGAVFWADEPAAQRLRDALGAIGGHTGLPWDQLLYAWVLSLPNEPVVVSGTGNLDRLRAAVSAVDVQLDRQDWYALLEAAVGREVP